MMRKKLISGEACSILSLLGSKKYNNLLFSAGKDGHFKAWNYFIAENLLDSLSLFYV
jgi:hypothetical protein